MENVFIVMSIGGESLLHIPASQVNIPMLKWASQPVGSPSFQPPFSGSEHPRSSSYSPGADILVGEIITSWEVEDQGSSSLYLLYETHYW